MGLKVIEVSRVSPASDSVDSLDIPLTLFDLLWIRFHPVERAFFYQSTELTREFFDSIILPKLKHSLSVVLCHYLPVAGRITWDPQKPKPSVVVTGNDAVLLTVAETDADFNPLSGYNQRPATELRRLVPELSASDDSASIVSLQITLFPNQGFCIGVVAHHAVLDGKTTSMFIKAWAHICNEEHESEVFASLPEDLTPCFDRTVIKYPVELDSKLVDLMSYFGHDNAEARSLKLMPARETGDNVTRVTLELTRENIQKLRDRVKNESSKHHHLSTFVVTYAYVWTCMVKARGGDANRPVAFGFVADYRDRLDPPAPATYFGNCIVPVGCFEAKAGPFMEEKGFALAVEMVSDLVKGLSSRGIEEIYEELVEGMKKVKPGMQVGSVAGSTRLGVYRMDFGWGKPVKVEVISIDESRAFSMAETRDGTNGVEIGLSLVKPEVETFISLFQNGLK
ncbi:PREDICTED: phenolic glucoside malonyltransferase 2-like isoform X2 [Tarenaya hassleriana]|uniref:phenolic glucoside malonyltransferase 2-like isoform X1 n=1 Tax=Tarenaya hassleriana TaxID=28532 RepID=UPI00053C80FB|nr:PREDICTED: phenolic glucoside malonyltransferase 2-like isoform X1 [Tarenaya hassleriana]XP_010553965.1 PREDICTED: phenolic glucoside malonyltransferase 2-like isoform X2 [Tarenaya hassleriana]